MFKCIKRKEKEIEFINEDGEKILSYLYSAKNFSKKFFASVLCNRAPSCEIIKINTEKESPLLYKIKYVHTKTEEYASLSNKYEVDIGRPSIFDKKKNIYLDMSISNLWNKDYIETTVMGSSVRAELGTPAQANGNCIFDIGEIERRVIVSDDGRALLKIVYRDEESRYLYFNEKYILWQDNDGIHLEFKENTEKKKYLSRYGGFLGTNYIYNNKDYFNKEIEKYELNKALLISYLNLEKNKKNKELILKLNNLHNKESYIDMNFLCGKADFFKKNKIFKEIVNKSNEAIEEYFKNNLMEEDENVADY